LLGNLFRINLELRPVAGPIFVSADFKEGMEAFLQKRPPKWTGS
jgi:enoyl-CoA hydratase/carnithine racemase